MPVTQYAMHYDGFKSGSIRVELRIVPDVQRANSVWVSNHTSMIDYIILTAYSPFAVIMQLHQGWVSTCALHPVSETMCPTLCPFELETG